MQKIIIKISGIHCASCVLKIEKKLTKEPGIKKASVNLVLGEATISYDEKIINFEKIIDLINNLGYPALIKKNNDEKEDRRKEITIIKNQFILSFMLGLPLLYYAIFKILKLPIPKFLEINDGVIQFVLTTLIIYISRKIWKDGLMGIVKLRPDMDSLIFIGSSTAYLYSFYVMVMMAMNFSFSLKYLYFDSAAFILIFISLGRFLEAYTRGKTSEAIEKLMGIQSKFATVIKNKNEERIPISMVKVEDIILVKPGEKIPVDGVVIQGYSGVDEKTITGESIPVFKKKGDWVTGSTINMSSSLLFVAKRVGSETTISQIISVVEEALNSKAKLQIIADKIAFYFVPAVISVAILSFISWFLISRDLNFAISIFVSVLIIACPCALGLATPTAVAMGTALCAQNGILIKNANSLSKAENADVVVFDKTGTLTKGEPSITKIIGSEEGKWKTKNILQYFASMEKYSNHPLAKAIVLKAKQEKLKLIKANDFEEVPGKGLKGKLDGLKVLLGTKKFLEENNITNEILIKKAYELEKMGDTVVFLAIENKLVGFISISDTLKDNVKETVDELHLMGKKVYVITGDNKRVGKAIAESIGADRVMAEILPQGKAEEIKKLQISGKKVVMVGDGINDAPAIAKADLGIALGSGSDIAMETGEIVLVKDDLRDVIKAIKLSQFISHKIKQNLFWAFIYNSVSIPVAAGVIFPLTGWLLNPSVAALAMAFSSVSVVINSLTIKNYKI